MTASDFLPFTRPSITDAEVDAVAAVLRSGWITTGPVVGELEGAFAAAVGARHAVSVCSATAGMHLALLAAGVRPGDEVVTPAMTWVSTVNLIELIGAVPVFVDVDRETLMTDAARIEPLIGPRTRAIVPVHFAGAPLDIEPLRALAARHGVALIEDAAHAAGATLRGEPIGGAGTAIFSFHAIKNMTTAEGGMVCTDDEAIAGRVRRLRFHGLGVDAYDRETQGRAPQAEVIEPGFKYNLPDVNAALGLAQLARLPENNARRARLAARYLERLDSIPGVRPLGSPPWPHAHARHLMVVRVEPDELGMDRDAFMAALKERGIGTGIHFRAVHEHRYYRERYPSVRLPDTEWSSARICSLPLFPDMRDADVDRVVDAIASLARRVPA